MRSQKKPARGQSAPAGNTRNSGREHNTAGAEKGKRDPFTLTDNEVMLKLWRIPRPAADVWRNHQMHQGGNDSSWCSLDTICDEVQMNKDTVCKWRKWLIEHGWLIPAGKREKKAGTFRVPMFKAVVGEEPLLKRSEAVKDMARIRSFQKRSALKPSEAVRSEAVRTEVDSKKQVDSQMQEDSENPSPDGAKGKTADRGNDSPGGGVLQIPAHASSDKNSLHEADQDPEVEMNESAMLPAVDVSVPDTRYQQFKNLIFRMYWQDQGKTCVWDEREGKQLKDLLVTYPDVDEPEFAQWLENYMFSEDRTPGQRPYRFLPLMDRYTIEPLDRFGRGISTACR